MKTRARETLARGRDLTARSPSQSPQITIRKMDGAMDGWMVGGRTAAPQTTTTVVRTMKDDFCRDAFIPVALRT